MFSAIRKALSPSPKPLAVDAKPAVGKPTRSDFAPTPKDDRTCGNGGDIWHK